MSRFWGSLRGSLRGSLCGSLWSVMRIDWHVATRVPSAADGRDSGGAVLLFFRGDASAFALLCDPISCFFPSLSK